MRMVKQSYMILIGVSLIIAGLMLISSQTRLHFLEDSTIASTIVGCDDDWYDNSPTCSPKPCPPNGYSYSAGSGSGFCYCKYDYWNCPDYDVTCTTNTPIDCWKSYTCPLVNCGGLCVGYEEWETMNLVCELDYDPV